MLHSIRIKIIAIVFVCLVLPMVIGASYIIESMTAQISHTKLNDLINIVDAKYIHLLDMLHLQKSLASSWAAEPHIVNVLKHSTPDLIEDLSEDFTHWANAFTLDEHAMKAMRDRGEKLQTVFGREVRWDIYRLDERINRYHDLLLIDRHGIVLMSAKENRVGEDISASDVFLQGKKQVYLSEMYEDSHGHNVVSIAAPVMDPKSNAFLGLFIMNISDDYLTDLVSGDLGNQVGGKLFFAGYTPSTDFYLISPDGYMMTQSKVLKENTVLKQPAKTLAWRRCMDESLPVREAQEFYQNYAGVEVGGASMCVFDKQWTLVAEQNKDEILESVDNLSWLMTGVFTLAIILSAILAYIFLQLFLVRRIKWLKESIQDVNNGNLTPHTCFDKDGDELDDLANGFNQMVNSLHTSQEYMQASEHQRLEALGLMAGGVAHDFNNLLLPIIGYAEAIMKHECCADKAQAVLDVANQASRLCRQMLSYSGSSKLAAQTINLGEMISQMRGVLASTVKPYVRIRFELNKTLAMVRIDIANIEQVLLNMVVNASDALAEKQQGAEIVISTFAYAVTEDDLKATHVYHKDDVLAGDYVAFQVSDNGCGMADAVLAKLFDPFFTTKFTGRGLGMSAVLGIVHAHKGVLRVESTADVGTRFTVALPIYHEAEPAHEPVVAALEPATVKANATQALGLHVLIIDDDALVTAVMSMRLTELVCTFETADNGLLGLECYREHAAQIDVIILDMTMPVMSGAECFAKLKEIDAKAKIILSSGYAQEDVQSQLSEQHSDALPDAYLPKPYSLADLRSALEMVN